MISADRYSGGRMVVRIQDVVDLEPPLVFNAAICSQKWHRLGNDMTNLSFPSL